VCGSVRRVISADVSDVGARLTASQSLRSLEASYHCFRGRLIVCGGAGARMAISEKRVHLVPRSSGPSAVTSNASLTTRER